MNRTPLAAALATIALLLALLTAPPAHADPGPQLRLSNAELSSALVCPQPARHPDKQTVLLVHGTGGSGAEHYGDGLGPVLTRQGFDWFDKVQPLEENHIFVASGDSVFTASKVLNMPAVLAGLRVGQAPHGVVFAVPDRWTILLHVVDERALGAVSDIARYAASIHGQSPYPIAPTVYHWHQGTYSPIAGPADDGHLEVRPTPDLMAFIQTLATD